METRLDTVLGKWKVTALIANYSVPTSEAAAHAIVVSMITMGGGAGNYNWGVDEHLHIQKRVMGEIAGKSRKLTTDQWAALCRW